VLVTAIGTTLIRAGCRRDVHPDVAALAGLSAAALATADVVFVAQRRISPVYLLDAGPEVALAAWRGRNDRMVSGGEGTSSEGEAARRKGGRMETGRQVDRGSEAGPLERDGAHRFGFGVAAVAAAVALAMAWRAYQRGRGETIAAAEARMEPRPVVY
jgi:hypothetical protein